MVLSEPKLLGILLLRKKAAFGGGTNNVDWLRGRELFAQMDVLRMNVRHFGLD